MPRRLGILSALLAPGALAALISSWRLGAAPLTDSEAFYAEIAREMYARRDWLTPTFDFARFFDKPPLYYWLELLAFRAFGPTELAARLPSAFAFCATAILTAAIGVLLFDELTGLIAGCLLASTMGFFVYGHTALIEPVLALWITAAVAAFWWWRQQSDRPIRLYAVYAAAALGTLTKGLTGVVFPAAVIIAYCALRREGALLRRALSPAGIGLFALIVAPWHLWSAAHHPGFLWFHFIHEQLLRFSGSMIVVYHPFPTPLFLASMALMIFPWSLYVPQAFLSPWNIWRGPRVFPEAPVLFVQTWGTVILLFFCLSHFKLDYYSIPAWPPVLLMIGKYLADGIRSRRVLAGLWVPAAAIALIGVAGLLALPWLRPVIANRIPDPRILGFCRWTFLLLLAGGLAATAASIFRRTAIGIGLLAGMMLPILLLAEKGMALIEPERSSVEVAKIAATCLDRLGGGRIVQGESDEDIYVGVAAYYTGRKVWLMKSEKDQSFPFPHIHDERFFVTPAQLARDWKQQAPLLLIDESGSDAGRPWASDPRAYHLVWKNRRHRLIANRPVCDASLAARY